MGDARRVMLLLSWQNAMHLFSVSFALLSICLSPGRVKGMLVGGGDHSIRRKFSTRSVAIVLTFS